MKGRVKDKIKISLIIAASLVATILAVSIISGRLSMEEIIVVKKEGIDINKPLDQQLEFFGPEEISKREFDRLGGIVTDYSQLANKKINIPLEVKSPILLSMLIEPNSGGKFATTLEEGSTIYQFPQAGVGLPPIEKGDKINVGLTFQDENELGEQEYVSSILLYDLELANVVGYDLYAKVSLQQNVILQSAAKAGEFFFQLPGKQEIPFCSDLEEEEKVNCLDEDYLPEEINQNTIISKLNKGEALNRTDKEIEKELERILKEIEEEKEEEKAKTEEEDNKNEEDENEEDNVASGEECTIKGTESMIYHTPDSQYYDQTNEYELFCSIEEAEEAGYRAAE